MATTLDAPERCETCFDKTSREVSAYRDPYTGQFLNVWNNTMTGKLNEVRPGKVSFLSVVHGQKLNSLVGNLQV